MAGNRKDWTGQKFGSLTLTKGTDILSGKTFLWETTCDCGKSRTLRPSDLKNGSIYACHECMAEKRDFTGLKYEKLTFVKATGKRNNSNQPMWELRCDCGNTYFSPPALIRGGHTKSCGCYRTDQSYLTGCSERGKENGKLSRIFSPEISTARTVWQTSRYSPDCDFDTFLELSQLPCYYCGRLPYRNTNRRMTKSKIAHSSEEQKLKGTFTYNGLDRKDPAKGHTPDNIVPCCKDCNVAKLSMSIDAFRHLVDLIHFNMKKLDYGQPAKPFRSELVDDLFRLL